MSDPTAELKAEIAALTHELEQLPLEKSARDRRLALNARVEQKRAELEAKVRAEALRAELSAVSSKLAALDPQASAERRALSRERSRLEAALAELSRPGV